MAARLISFRSRETRLTFEDASTASQKVLTTPIAQRLARSRELRLDDPELLLCLCELLRSQFQSSPTTVRDEADFFHQYLLSKPHIGLYDEREFFLGEFALLAGTASRMLFRREEATRWFERAEARFVLTANSATNIARLAYQRLALRTEE